MASFLEKLRLIEVIITALLIKLVNQAGYCYWANIFQSMGLERWQDCPDTDMKVRVIVLAFLLRQMLREDQGASRMPFRGKR